LENHFDFLPKSILSIDLTPELILGLFVPPLIFEAAFHLNFSKLRRNVVSVLTFAITRVILTTFFVGWACPKTGWTF
jgi:CPA1 family monovalent cation:H+ antiporter